MLYVSPGWSTVFTVDLNVSSLWASAVALLHQSHLASLGRTASIVSPLKMIMDWLACVTIMKLSTHFSVTPATIHQLLYLRLLCNTVRIWLVFLVLSIFPVCVLSSDRSCPESQLGSWGRNKFCLCCYRA